MTRMEQALVFALRAHSGMRRRQEDIPYILHPMEVATIAATMTNDDDVLAAALLHDTLEDTSVTREELKAAFGQRVTELVLSETEDKHAELSPDASWRLRKTESLEALQRITDRDVKILWLSDKLANLRSFYRQYRILGDSLWNAFHQKNPAEQGWYYRSIADAVRELENEPAWQEYRRLIELVFEGVEEE